MKVNAWILSIGVMTSVLFVGGCVQSYTFSDFETYVKPRTDVSRYKRAAILYVGYTAASSEVQKDVSGKKEESLSMDSDHHANDVVMYSNALINALASRGVTLVERNRVQDLVREQGLLQQELVDLSEIEKVRRLGKLLKVDFLVRGTIFAEKGGWYLTPRGKPYFIALTGLSVTGVDTTTGEVVWVDTTYMAQRITPKAVEKQPTATGTAGIFTIVDDMVARFWEGGSR